MEVGNNTLHDVERVARGNHNLRIGVQGGQIVAVKIIEYLLQRLQCGEAIIPFLVGHPLSHTQLLFHSIGTPTDEHTYIV